MEEPFPHPKGNSRMNKIIKNFSYKYYSINYLLFALPCQPTPEEAVVSQKGFDG